MLTIREPIALKTQNPIQGIRQDMAERMQANYGLMNMSIRKEELLHITSESPEVYFAEGDSLQVFNNIQTQNQQEIRLDVINNLINRIMVSQTENFTYQDTVYISSVLRRLGIRDEKTFMKQVFALQNEHKETRQLLQKYEENQEILQKLFMENNAQPKSGAEKAAEVSERERRYYIHDEIFQRLETGKVYQDIRHYSKGTRHESQQIFRTEMSVGEQASQVQNFMLHTLKQRITNNETPFYYYHNNQYEFLQELTENIEESLEEQMSAAILLNIADQSYTLRQEQIEQNSHNWYSLAGALFQTAENTWKRYEANLLERKFISNDMLQVLEEVTERKRVEGDTISSITEEYKKIDQQWNHTLENQTFLLHHSIQEGKREKINITGGSYHLTQEELELNFLTQEQEENEKEPETITIEQLQKQLEVFNQQNYENYKKITQIEKTQPRVKNRTLDRKKAQKDALRALENPTEVLREYLTTEIHDPVREAQKQVENQIYALFSDDTKEIYRQFLQQNTSTDTTFLQHIMDQPEENEVRREVLQTLEHVEHEEVIRQLRQETERNIASARTQVEVEQLQKQLEILNRRDYENYRKILEIEKLEADRKATKAGEERHFQEPSITHENFHEILHENTITEGSSFFTETEKELEKQMYHLFSEKTKNVYEQYYLQNKNTEISFLQHVMNGEEESEVRQEVLQTLEHVEYEEVLQQLRQEIERNIASARTEVEVKLLQKHLEIINRKDYENYRKIVEIERLQADTEGRKAAGERSSNELRIIHQRINERLQEYITAGREQLFTEIEKEIEKQIYDRFSEKTTNLPEQYYLQNEKTETPFLQHIINQVEESEAWQEVLQTLEHVGHERVLQQLRQEIERNIEVVRTETEAGQLHKQLEILNRRDYETYQKIAEIEKLQASTKGGKTVAERPLETVSMIHEKTSEVLREYITTEVNSIFTQVEKEVEKQIYDRFSKETKTVYQQFLTESREPEQTFIQYLLEQPQESETRQEMIQALQTIEYREIMQKLQDNVQQNRQYVQQSVSHNINEEIRQQLNVLNNLQASTLYEQWTLPAEIFWQREKEKETLLDQQITTQQQILRAKSVSMVKAPDGSMPQEESLPLKKQDLVHPAEQVETEELYQQNEQRDILHMQETKLTDVRQNIEKKIVLQQRKASVKFMAEQKEMQFKTIDFVHKAEEQLINEELLEEIRMQKQNTKREEHTENRTVENSRSINQTVQETINHVQTNRIEDIEQIVQQSVKKQLNNLSDQVYGKIEKKLQTERKRRGYF